MLRSTFYQVSLLQVEPDTIGLDAGSFERGLRDVLLELVDGEFAVYQQAEHQQPRGVRQTFEQFGRVVGMVLHLRDERQVLYLGDRHRGCNEVVRVVSLQALY